MPMISETAKGVITFEDGHDEFVTSFYKDGSGWHMFVGEHHYILVEAVRDGAIEYYTYESEWCKDPKGHPFEAWIFTPMKYVEIYDDEDSLWSFVLS